jgi:hypothetical protein
VLTSGNVVGNTDVNNNGVLNVSGRLGGTLTGNNSSVIRVSGNVVGATTLNNSTSLAVTGNLQSTLTLNQNATANIQTGANVTGAAIVNSGSLTSNGSFGSLTINNGATLYTSSTGSRVNGPLTFNNGSIWNATGANLTDFSKITTTGLVTIAPNANLTLMTPANMLYPDGITLIDQTGNTPINQTTGFANFVQGTFFRNNNNTFFLNYNGSAGNYTFNSNGVDMLIQMTAGKIMVLNPNLTTNAGQQFNSNLNIRVISDFNTPLGVPGIPVMITLPANVNNCNIASGRFDNANYSNRTITLTSDSNGNISIPIWANDNPGPFQANITNLFDTSEYNYPYMGVVGVALQRQSINRSYIRYMDVVLSEANLTTLGYNPTNFRNNFTMTRTRNAGYTGGANITDNNNYLTLNNPNVYTTPVGYTIDFGPGGLGNQPATTTYDGVYQLVANGTVVPSNAPYSFHRLLGDANGDGTVNALDTNLIQSVLLSPPWRYQNASNLTYVNSNMSATSSNPLATFNWVGDLNGDGKINALDLNISTFQRGRRVTYTRRVT